MVSGWTADGVRMATGTDISAAALNLLNENPSLVALGKKVVVVVVVVVVLVVVVVVVVVAVVVVVVVVVVGVVVVVVVVVVGVSYAVGST